MSQKIYLAILLIVALVPTALFSQGPGGGGPGGGGSSYSISGDSSVDQGDVKNYSISHNTGISSAQWSALPASAVSINTPTLSETNITFIGNGTMTLYMEMTDNFANNHFLNKTVSVAQTVPDGPPDPTVPNGTNCDTATLTRSGSPPSGITWYWQGKNASGQSTTKGSGSTFTANEGSGTYYIRAYDTTTSEWSFDTGSVSVTITDTPNQPNGNGDTICAGDTATLTASGGGSNVTYKWYTSSGSYLASGSSYTTNALNSDTTFRVLAERGGSCTSSYRTVTVTVLDLSAPTTTGGSNSCGSPNSVVLEAENLLIATGTPGVEHIWYTSQTGSGTVTSTQDTNNPVFKTTRTVTSAATYWVSVKQNGCESPRTQVSATFTTNNTPTLQVNDISGPVCENDNFTLRATGGSSGSTYEWYTSATGGTPFTGDTFTDSSTYAASNNGTVTYYVGGNLKNSMGCDFPISPRVAVTATILPPVTQAPTVNVASTCGSNSVTLTASGIANATYRWYNASGVFQTSTNPYTLTVPNGTTDFTVSAVVGGCEGPVQTVSVTVGALPGLATGNTSFSRCGNGSVALTATPGSNANTIRWYDAATGGTELATGTTFNTPSLSSATVYYAESYNSTGGCAASSRLAVTANIANTITWYVDLDGDQVASGTVSSCTYPGPGHTETVLPTGDCDDNNANVIEPRIWYQDSDGDGLGDPAVATGITCIQPQNYVANADDLCPTVSSSVNDCNGGHATNPQDHNYVYTRSYREGNVGNVAHFTQDDDLVQEITFLDGLGRPLQQTAIAQSPTRKDIVTFMEYDAVGRSEKQWLPYAVTDNAVADFRTGAQTATEQFYNTPKYENTLNAYSQKTFEPSPLDRTDSQAAPGNSWAKGAGHEIEFEYEMNTISDNVRRLRVTLIPTGDAYFPALADEGNYVSGELAKKTTFNNDHPGSNTKLYTMEEFTDKSGQTVLKRTYALESGTVTAHDTYYVYNDYGNLAFVLPPLMDASNASLSSLTGNINTLAYRYVYDRRNRLVEKQLPGKGKEYIVYNTLDQPIMTQDALQRTRDEWLFTKYDVWGRVAYTGKVTNTDDRPAVQTSANSVSGNLWVARQTNDQNNAFTDDVEIFYDNGAYPTAGITEILTINYYDDYGFTGDPFPQTRTAFGVTSDTRTKGLTTGTKVRVLDTGVVHWITTVSYYDNKARPIYVQTENSYLGTIDIASSKLGFDNSVLIARNQHQRGSLTVVTLDNFTYDHTGRLVEQTQCIGGASLGETCAGSGAPTNLVLNGPTVTNNQVATGSIVLSGTVTLSGTASLVVNPNAGNDAELLVRNTYDELGQLESKEVGGDASAANALQTVDYSYNVRGWLTGINDADDTDNTLTRDSDDLFAFRIAYDEGAGALYNGNIARTEWRTANTDTGLKGYDYTYDALNRIKTATGLSTTNYDVSNISYDRNGNILTLNRKGHINAAATSFGDMDLLSYTYDGNKLIMVEDTASNDQFGFKDDALNQLIDDLDDYEYDVNGNMYQDDNKNITNITYNHLNLPTSIDIDSGNISYIYDATGVKLQKTISAPSNVMDYINGYVYENGELQFLSHSEGYVSPINAGGYDYVFQYTDNLGNIRLSYAGDISNPGSAIIVEENNYYPYGLKHRGYNMGGDSSLGNDVAQRWKYNGKEYNESFGLQTYDFGARNYNPDLGRWMNLDPLAEEMRRHSPYNYAFDNPIYYLDPDGMAPTTYKVTDEHGNEAELNEDQLNDYIAANGVTDDFDRNNLPNDWVYDKENDKYVWKDEAIDAKSTPEGYEYVGESTSDVKEDWENRSSNYLQKLARKYGLSSAEIDYESYFAARKDYVGGIITSAIEGQRESIINEEGTQFNDIEFDEKYLPPPSAGGPIHKQFDNLTFEVNGQTFTSALVIVATADTRDQLNIVNTASTATFSSNSNANYINISKRGQGVSIPPYIQVPLKRNDFEIVKSYMYNESN